jgi:hypothetical protein
MCAIPLSYFWLNHLTIVPQSSRYQLELEMALCLLFGCAVQLVLASFAANCGADKSDRDPGSRWPSPGVALSVNSRASW